MKKKWLALATTALLTISLATPSLQETVSASRSTSKVDYTGDIIYQIMTDRFSDGDKANNPTGALYSAGATNLKKYAGGDWRGIINKVNDGYFTDMGVTALWISQPVENVYSVMNDTLGSTSYHGYWARDFKKPNPFFGSLADFKELISVAHSKGLKVIIDFAPNHTSPASYDVPSYMENGALYNNGTLVANYTNDPTGVFHKNGGTSFSTLEDGTYRNLFDLADFNHQNGTVDQYLKDAIKMWLDLGIDGIRMDAVKHMPFGWQKTFMDTVYNYRPVFTFGEWFLSEGEADPKYYDFANESGMSLLDFRYGQKLRQVLRNNSDTWASFHQVIAETENYHHEVNDQVTFIDNHDMDRFNVDGGNPRKVDMALALLLTSRGVPNIYYGTEQYMTGNGDPENRRMMTSFNRTTTAYKVVQKLAPLRKQNEALAHGKTVERWMNGDVYVYERQFGNDVVLVAMNKSDKATHTITGAMTNLPAGVYQDELGGLLGGNGLSVSATKAVASFELSPGEVGVWSYNGNAVKPTIGHVGPMVGQVGNTVTIGGESFGLAAGTVKFGTVPATVVSWNDKEIVVKVPTLAGGKYDVTVTSASNLASNTYPRFEVLSGKQVSVRFLINNATTSLGQNVYLVGNVSELGNWDPAKAVGPFFNSVIRQYPNWYYDVSVPAGKAIEYKFIKKDNAGNVVWESGANHVYTTPTAATGTSANNWQN